MISAMSWVPKGAAKSVPVEAEPPTQEEIEEAMKSITLGREGSDADADEGDGDDDGDMELDGAEELEEVDEVAQAKAAAKALAKSSSDAVGGVADELAELNMDDYDDEEEALEIFSSGVLGDMYYTTNDEDPYLIKNKDKDDDDDDEDDSEIEDNTIKPTDLVIVCAHNEDEINSLLVNILEETEHGEPNMFVHHEVPLADFPLCTAWMDFKHESEDKGNFIAVGTMGPAIEIWDLDIVDEVQPQMVLGGLSKKKKTKGKKGKKYKKGSHRSSVLGLAWNQEFRNVLASASADKTVKIWDLNLGKCAATLQHHDDKVQSVAWNRQSPRLLLSGSFDKSVATNNVEEGEQSCCKWSVEADVESLAWDPHNEHVFVVSLENGMVQAFDTRTASSNSDSARPMFTLHAHEKAASSISFSPSTPNFLATGSTDKTVKLWDLSNNQPSCLASLNPKLGAIFSVSFSNDSPFLLACGGSKGKLKVWNTLTEPGVANKFGK